MWSLLAFVAAAAVLTITPGADTIVVLRSAAARGPAAGAGAALGVCCGLMVWGAGVALGLAALLAASATAYTALKWAGAAYLFWLGAQLLLKPRSAVIAPADADARGGGARAAFGRGLLTNLLNPKIGVFYVSFLPQFVPAGANVGTYCLLLTAIHALLGALWFALLVGLAAAMRGVLQNPAVLRRMDRLAGCVFLAFGVRLAAFEG